MKQRLFKTCLAKSKTLSRVYFFLKNFGGLELVAFDPEGQVVRVLSEQEDVSLSAEDATFAQIDPVLIDRCRETLMPVNFLDKQGNKKHLIPLYLETTIIGFLMTGETAQFRLTDLQFKAMTSFLKDVIFDVLIKELNTFQDLDQQDMSHHGLLLSKVMNYLDHNYQNPDLSMSDVAKECGISYHHLSRLFNKTYKMNFASYLSQFRVNISKRLLKDQTMTISQVSRLCGFEDPGYFCKVFKKYEDVTPVVFRGRNLLRLGNNREEIFAIDS